MVKESWLAVNPLRPELEEMPYDVSHDRVTDRA
jgi:hypothetical protein